MNVLDSSAWLECFAGGANARHFLPTLENPIALLVPAVVHYEVFKRLLQQRSKEDALKAVAQMQEATLVPLDIELALLAADLSLAHRLPLADSMILATARAHDAVLWTQDADFAELDNVRYFPKAGGAGPAPA